MEEIVSECGVRYLSCEDLILINQEVMSYTPSEHCGIFDQSSLESAQAKPSQFRFYEQCEDVFTLAACLFISINKAHAFRNGNKRTAFLASVVFLNLNGFAFEPQIHTVIDVSISVATSETDYENPRKLSSWFKAFSRELNAEELQQTVDSSVPVYQNVLNFKESAD